MASITNIFKMKEGTAFDSEKFKDAIAGLNAEMGAVRQYWGEQLENPGLVTWVVDFHSAHDVEMAKKSGVFRDVGALLNELLDEINQESANLTTKWTSSMSEVTAAMQSNITEVAFFILSTTGLSVDEARKAVEVEMDMICDAVKKYGNAKGAAIGWLKDKETDGVGLHGIFGYDSLEDHMEWRKHPVHVEAQDAFARLEDAGVVLRPDVSVKGIDPATGYFHVEFECA